MCTYLRAPSLEGYETRRTDQLTKSSACCTHHDRTYSRDPSVDGCQLGEQVYPAPRGRLGLLLLLVVRLGVLVLALAILGAVLAFIPISIPVVAISISPL